ncbi:MAG: SigB/SigF/SigG family RNA polymerase sigma factor [Clostridia bacterium]
MYKVEIKNLNTAELPRLANKDQLILLAKAKTGDNIAREEFIYANLRLVLSLVQKFNNRGENVDDIFQVGVIGLLKSIDNFDMNLNVQFSTYAVPMIIGEIKRFLRDSSTLRVSRSLRDIAYKIMKEKEIYINQYSKEPTLEELSKLVEESIEDIVVALDSMVQPVSIYETVYNDAGNSISIVDQIKDDINEAEELTNKMTINSALEKLTPKERNIINKRFFQNKTQVELAKEIGVSQAQISRIEKVALCKMKKRIDIDI